MAVPQVNGDVDGPAHSSAFVQHLANYPLVSDAIASFKAHEYGQLSLRLGDSAYQALAAPVMPWIAKPCGYLSPYVQKADSLGDRTLNRLDARFPAVKKPTSELYHSTRALLLLPYRKGLEGRDHVLGVYAAHVNKADRPGIVAQGRAAVSTAVVVSNETLAWLSSLLTATKADAAKPVNEKVQQ